MLPIVVIVALLLMMRNAAVLFTASIRKGRIVALRGRAPKGLVRDFNDVLRVRPVAEATLKVVSRGGAPALISRGALTEEELQRLRNILGTWPIAKIRAAPYRST